MKQHSEKLKIILTLHKGNLVKGIGIRQIRKRKPAFFFARQYCLSLSSWDYTDLSFYTKLFSDPWARFTEECTGELHSCCLPTTPGSPAATLASSTNESFTYFGFRIGINTGNKFAKQKSKGSGGGSVSCRDCRLLIQTLSSDSNLATGF